jgi:hypothetical protein
MFGFRSWTHTAGLVQMARPEMQITKNYDPEPFQNSDAEHIIYGQGLQEKPRKGRPDGDHAQEAEQHAMDYGLNFVEVRH